MKSAPIVLAACLLLQACATPPPPPPPPPPDLPEGVTASAPAIGTAVKSVSWLARLLMRLAANTTVHIDVQTTTTTPGAKP